MKKTALLLLVFVAVLVAAPRSLSADVFDDDAERTKTWAETLHQPREVVDRVVVCFDESAFLRELAKWDEKRFWPVLLWDSALVPKFVAAFGPRQLLLAKPGAPGDVTLESGRAAVAGAWEAGEETADTAAFLAVLQGRERAALGTVLLDAASPEFLGGLALAAGRFHLPLVFPTEEKHDKRITDDRVEEIRERLRQALIDLGVEFESRMDDLDFVTVANDMPFGYSVDEEGAHPGGYTVDDAIARNSDPGRWGWVGRLLGGPARSVYMVMGALFLQPENGLFFSRYNPKNDTFGPYDPEPAFATFERLFPIEMIRHPDATLARWRALEWPGGNRFGLVLVNSSGGATSWSTSKGGATHFDVPDTVPCVVHYTHSGSAGRPFHLDSIAGRWMAGGAYFYFGSYAEPYLQAFVPATVLAERVDLGVPLGAAMRLPYGPRRTGQRMMKVGEEERLVRFNMSGPWKLACFGDPSFQLRKPDAERVEPDRPKGGYHTTLKSFRKSRSKGDAAKARHALDALGVVVLDRKKTKLVDEWGWGKVLKALAKDADRGAVQREMVRVWLASLRRAGAGKLYSAKALKKLTKLPKPIARLLADGAASEEAGRQVAEFAKAYVEGIGAHPESDVGKDPQLARWVLEMASSFAQPKGWQKPFYAWVVEASRALGVAPDDIREAVLARDGIPDGARKGVAAVKGQLESK